MEYKITPKLDRFGLVSKKRRFDFCSFSPNATCVEVLRSRLQKMLLFQHPIRNSPNGRSHEVQRKARRENGFCADCWHVGVQPVLQTPLKTRKNPAAAGSRERFRRGKWRRGWDRTHDTRLTYTPLAGERLQPLGHLSTAVYAQVRARLQEG